MRAVEGDRKREEPSLIRLLSRTCFIFQRNMAESLAIGLIGGIVCLFALIVYALFRLIE